MAGSELSDEEVVARQYADDRNLRARQRLWQISETTGMAGDVSHDMPHRRRSWTAATAVALAVTAGACGSGDDPALTTGRTDGTATTELPEVAPTTGTSQPSTFVPVAGDWLRIDGNSQDAAPATVGSVGDETVGPLIDAVNELVGSDFAVDGHPRSRADSSGPVEKESVRYAR